MQNVHTSKKIILAWCLYDWAISAFPVIVTTFIFAAFFTSKIADNKITGTELWGQAIAIAGIVIAILSPLLGAIADFGGKRKRWLGGFTVLLSVSSALLWFAYPSSSSINFVLLCVIFGTIGFNLCSVFYNAILPTIATPNRVGRISGWGWGLGYFGGLTILLIAYYGFINSPPAWINQSNFGNIRICGPLVALWVSVFALPLFFIVPEQTGEVLNLKQAILSSLHDVWAAFFILWKEKNLLIFLVAQMVYLDGLNTLFAFGGIYAAGTFHMTMSDVLLYGIAMNMFAGIGSIVLTWVSDVIGAKWTIFVSLLALSLFGLGIVLVQSTPAFWVLGCCLSLFVGALQSSSRTYLAILVPPAHTTLMFGFSSLSGKISMFLGPLLLGLMTVHFNSQRVGMASVLLFFMVGAGLIWFVSEPNKVSDAQGG